MSESGKMGLGFKPVSAVDPVFDEFKMLYEDSFPAIERRPFAELVNDFGDSCDFLAVLEEDRFVGLVIILTHKDLTHILYLAVKPELRDRGYGSQILELIRESYPGQRIIADLESPAENAANHLERERRASFYLKNGYSLTDISYRWEGEDYRIMSTGGNVTWDEFKNFWRFFYQR